MDTLEEVASNDGTPVSPATVNHDDQSATEGAPENVTEAELINFDPLHIFSIGGQSQYSVDVPNKNHRGSPPRVNSDAVANLPPSASIASTPSVIPFEVFCDAHRYRYSEEIQRLRKYMPHLNNVTKASRAHHRATFKCLDFSGGCLVSNEPRELAPATFKTETDFIQSLTGNIPSEVDHRLLLVDDLSDTLLSVLGNCLHITPEAFEEHLLNSGWHIHAYNDVETDLWTTRNLTKNYASMRWFRPIERRFPRPYQERLPGDLLDPSNIPDTWEERPSPIRRLVHSVHPLVNLLRRPWVGGIGSDSFSAWEERATVWDTNINGCHIILLLLDPLPTVRHQIKIIEKSKRDQKRRRASIRTRSQMRFRMVEDELATGSNNNEEPEEGGSSRDQVRRSFFARIIRGKLNLRKLGIAPTPDTELRAEERTPSSPVEVVPEDSRPKHIYGDHCLFSTFAPRLPVLDYQNLLSLNKDNLPPKKTKKKRKRTKSIEKSTSSVLEELIQSHSSQAADVRIAPLECLLVIILQDTLTILRSIDLAMTDMDDCMLDDELLQSRIDSWRRVLNRFEAEARCLETSLSQFAQYIVGLGGGKSTGTCSQLLAQCTLQLGKVQEHRRTTYGSLMTAMSLVESKRGISEAESVTKLTELAFFFIPLTFAASLFSMQVKELDADTTSVGVFFGIALTITACSYALRLAIRSSLFLALLGRWKNDIRKSMNSPAGSPIATTMVLKWMWKRLNPYMYPVYIMIPTAALLAGLWTRSLQEGIKAGVTIALIIVVFSAVVLLVALRRWG